MTPTEPVTADELMRGRSYEQALAAWLRTNGYPDAIRAVIAAAPSQTSENAAMHDAGEMLRAWWQDDLTRNAAGLPAGYVVMLRRAINTTRWDAVARFLALSLAGLS